MVIHKILVMSFNENLEDYNPTKKRKELVVFDDMIADMKPNKKLSPLVNELFLRVEKLYFTSFYVTIFQSYLKVPKSIRL